MACKYYYKGHKFNSEIELDDFLIENRRFESILGDAVFSTSPNVLKSVNATLTRVHNEAATLRLKYYELRQLNKLEYGEDGEESFVLPPYIGVTKFLSGLTNERGELLFPEFRDEEYWRRRYDDWKLGHFTETEIAEFGLDENNLLPIPKQAVGTENGKTIYNYDKMRDLIKNRWQIQAETGTAIHNVLLIVFSKTKGEYNFTYNDAQLKSIVLNKLSEKNKGYLSNEVIELGIAYARKLHEDLTAAYGEGLTYYPEFFVTQDTALVEADGSPTKLFGMIDLLVTDSKGRVHILDYKTSIHSYSDFGEVKKLAYTYLLATYQRMLELYGIDVYQGTIMVAPILIQNFRKEGDSYTFDSLGIPETFITINTSMNSQKMWDNIDEFLPRAFHVTVSGDHIGETVAKWMIDNFPSYSSNRTIDEEYTIDMLKKADLLKQDENGIFQFKKYGKFETPITADSEPEFVQKVTKYLKELPGRRLRLTGEVKNYIELVTRLGINSVDFPRPSDAKLNRDSDENWLLSIMAKYGDGNWEVVDNVVTESYGLIMLKTKNYPNRPDIPNQIDFIRVSTNDLSNNYRKYLNKGDNLKNRKGLTGTHESDVSALSKSGSLMAEAVNGNVELMESLAIINLLDGLGQGVIGNISVVNPVYADGMSLSNELLLYCFHQLNRFVPLPNNKIASGEIRFAKKYELVVLEALRIITAGENNDWKDEYKHLKGLKSAVPNYDSVVNADSETQIKELQNLLKEITKFNEKLIDFDNIRTKKSELSKVPISIYNNILIAIALLKGVNFRQLLKDHDKWLESIFIHLNGVSGSYLDNPGNLNSETLNLVTKLVTEAYLNTRDEMQRNKIEVRKLVDAVKEEANFGALKSVVGNLVNLYKDMYEQTEDGNFLFKNPNRLTGPKKALLEYALDKINRKRFPKLKDHELEAMKNNNDVSYYEVPLALGDADSVVSTLGLLSLLRTKLSYLDPRKAYERALRKVRGIYEDLYESEELNDAKVLNLFKMSNMFDAGLGVNRIEKIKSIGILNLEHNLETLLLKHMFAYSVLENMDAVFPMIKAAMVHITSEGAMRNKPFTLDIEYLEDYIKNKIHNKSIVNSNNLKWVNVANMIKLAASKLTLAFAPVQMFYQPLLGLWQDISLMIRKPDGKNSFTFQHFILSIKLVSGDLFHFSDKPTLCQLINELYGINDMDMNTYVDRISLAKKGIWNFENLMFKFASRPDFYNRMSIFTSLMMGDGCLEAHSINSDGQLVYDSSKDKRYAAFLNNDKSNIEEYNKARSLYYAAAQLFVIEHAKTADGKLFELNMNNPMPLPRAYTNKEAESMKSLGDDIYGYYSHEKKSLIMSTAIGSLWLLFKTYWSGKKNQYLAQGGVKLRGQWKHYEENGQKYYYQVDGNGNILYDKPPTTEETSAPVYQWEGQWQEGIILTLSDMVKTMYDKRSIKEGFKEKWYSEDINLRNAYRSNLKLMGYDLIMFGLIGSILGALLADWLDKLKGETRKNKDFTTGLGVAAANVAVMSVKNSFLDLNFIDSIGSPIGLWTPFAFEWGLRTLKNWWNVVTGDEDFWDGVVKSSGGLKQIKPVLDSIKPDMFRTEREGGTFGKK